MKGETERKLLILFGVPKEFQLEHPPKHTEKAGFPAPIVRMDLKERTYGIDLAVVCSFTLYPLWCVELPFINRR